MKAQTLIEQFEKHLKNVEIVSETEDYFVVKVLENYLIDMHLEGYTLGERAEDVYTELRDEVSEMLQKTTYGFFSLDDYREHLRRKTSKNKGDPETASIDSDFSKKKSA